MARRLGILLVGLLLFASPGFADEAQEQGERLDEIVRLEQAGVADAVILKYIATSGFVFYLSADDILQLRALGVSDVVMEALIDTAVGEQPRRRSSRIEYEYDNPLYVGVSAGYFSPWYWYPYAWGFYYDPFPSCYSFYYYPFQCSTRWGYYGSYNSYYYANCWNSYRYDYWPYYDELCRRGGGAVNVPVQGPGGEFAVTRARRPAAGVVEPSGPRRFARSQTPRRDVTPRLETSRRQRTRIHTRDAGAGQAVNTPQPSRRWSVPAPQARQVSQPTGRRSATPTQHLQTNRGMRVRQGSSAAPPAASPSHSPSRAAAPSAPSPAPARSPAASGSRLKFGR